METATISAEVRVYDQPIKGTAPEGFDLQLLHAQADVGRHNLVPVDYHQNYSTCGDERSRIGLRNGEAKVEPRPSVFGGSDVYALGIGELIGAFADDDTDGEAHLATAKHTINDAGIKSGGHEQCAANGKLGNWLATIASGDPSLFAYAHMNMGDTFDEVLGDEVVAYARAAVASGRYDAARWNEEPLARVLGDEAGEAIERLAPVDHKGYLLARVKIPGYTIDQTPAYAQSVLGEGIFVFDDPYAELIENAMAAGPDAEHKTRLARVAREMILAAVAGVVPNQLLFQSDFVATA